VGFMFAIFKFSYEGFVLLTGLIIQTWTKWSNV